MEVWISLFRIRRNTSRKIFAGNGPVVVFRRLETVAANAFVEVLAFQVERSIPRSPEQLKKKKRRETEARYVRSARTLKRTARQAVTHDDATQWQNEPSVLFVWISTVLELGLGLIDRPGCSRTVGSTSLPTRRSAPWQCRHGSPASTWDRSLDRHRPLSAVAVVQQMTASLLRKNAPVFFSLTIKNDSRTDPTAPSEERVHGACGCAADASSRASTETFGPSETVTRGTTFRDARNYFTREITSPVVSFKRPRIGWCVYRRVIYREERWTFRYHGGIGNWES